MPLSLFSESDYRVYIEKKLKTEEFGRGSKAKLAEALGCQPSFISQVLKEKNSFSLEQGFKLNEFFKHSDLEKDYFMTLLELGRAGSYELKTYYETKRTELQKKAELVENRIKYNELSELDTMAYFSNWNNVLIRQLLNIPEFNTKSKIKEKLRLDKDEVEKCLNFLTEKKLILKEGNHFIIGPQKLHVKKGSPVAQFANAQARIQCLKKLNVGDENAVNFGAQLTLSEKNFKNFKLKLSDLLADFHKSLSDDKPEKMCSLIIDFMEV